MNFRVDRLKELENTCLRISRIIERLSAVDRRFSIYRLSVFLSGTIGSVILYTLSLKTASAVLFFTALAAFLFISVRHRNVLERLKVYKIMLLIRESNIARLKLDWNKIKSFSDASFKPDLMENDLNLTGEQSLHSLLDTAASVKGSHYLRKWFKEPELSMESIKRRQDLVKELIQQISFREKLLLSALLSGKVSDGTGLLSWINSNSTGEGKLKKLTILLSVLAAVNILLIVLFSLGIIPAYWPVSALLYLYIYRVNQKQVEEIPDEVDLIKKELGSLSRVFRCIEKNRFTRYPNLRQLCLPFLEKETMPSVFMKKINKIVNVLLLRNNPVIWLTFIMIVPLDYIYAIKLGKLKNRISSLLPVWLNVYHELEALSSLANFAYLNPEYTFPEVYGRRTENEAYLKAEALGHPLIPADQKVRNSFRLDQANKINLITGSNMSGKSTFLRTLGINTALAFAGAPADASHMEVNLCRMFTCIKISDSVTDGISYFYAEVKRLKNMLLLLQEDDEVPVFFLIDEIFKGTNNVERLIGSRSYIKALSGKNGYGAITTHDLELTRIADEIPSARNFHFREKVEENVMTFDYLLREGPCPTTNALKIMKIEGLPIEENY